MMLSRREALTRILKYVISGGLLTIGWGFIKGTGARIEEVAFPELPKTHEVIYRDGVYLVGLEDGPAALAARCPHLGCQLEYLPGSAQFRCPCHGSAFGMDGERIKGPARGGMTPLRVKVNQKDGGRDGECCVELVLT